AREGSPRTPRQQLRVELLGIAGLILLAQAFKVMIVEAAPPMWQVMPSTLPGWIDLFAMGMALAVASAWTAEHGREPAVASARWAPWAAWALAAAAFWAVSTQIGLPRSPLYDATLSQYLARQALYGAFALFLLLPGIFGPQDRGLIRALLQNRAVQAAGLISYGIYLWHETLLTKFFVWFHRRNFQVSFPKLFLAILAATLATSAVTYLAVERPFLRMKDRRLLRLREQRAL
ncbi:MAG TPA: acyltransferase family protein, partial [Acidimicrobiales bacterium]